MIKPCDTSFYLWNLYFQAGVTIMDYVYNLNKNHIDKVHLEETLTGVMKRNNITLDVKDSCGCYTHKLCCRLKAKTEKSSNVFLFSDDSFSKGIFFGIYVESKDLFVRSTTGNGVLYACYYDNGAVDKYIRGANQYFEKSRNVAKNFSL